MATLNLAQSAHPPRERRHEVPRPEVIEPRLGVLLLPREPFLRPAPERPAGHEQAPGLEVVALDHARALDDRARAAQEIGVVVAPAPRVGLAAHDPVAREDVELPRGRRAARVDGEDAERGRALKDVDLSDPAAHLLGDPLARVVVGVRRGRAAAGEGDGQVLVVVADGRDRAGCRRDFAVGVVGAIRRSQTAPDLGETYLVCAESPCSEYRARSKRMPSGARCISNVAVKSLQAPSSGRSNQTSPTHDLPPPKISWRLRTIYVVARTWATTSRFNWRDPFDADLATMFANAMHAKISDYPIPMMHSLDVFFPRQDHLVRRIDRAPSQNDRMDLKDLLAGGSRSATFVSVRRHSHP